MLSSKLSSYHQTRVGIYRTDLSFLPASFFQSVLHPMIEVISGDEAESEAVNVYHRAQSEAPDPDQSQLLISVFSKRASVRQQSTVFMQQQGESFLPKAKENKTNVLIEELD